jgi:hypothetical protein
MIVAHRLLAFDDPERLVAGEGFLVAELQAEAAVAFADALSEIEIGLKPDRAAMA